MVMKKLIAFIALALMMALPMAARDEYAHDSSVLPEAAKTVIKNNFKSGVSLVKIDKDFGRVSEYDVVLKDGTEITFDSKGNWKEVETNIDKSVPKNFIPAGVQKFVSKAQAGARVVGIDKERNGYTVELSNGVEMKFDKNGNFKRYDN